MYNFTRIIGTRQHNGTEEVLSVYHPNADYSTQTQFVVHGLTSSTPSMSTSEEKDGSVKLPDYVGHASSSDIHLWIPINLNIPGIYAVWYAYQYGNDYNYEYSTLYILGNADYVHNIQTFKLVSSIKSSSTRSQVTDTIKSIASFPRFITDLDKPVMYGLPFSWNGKNYLSDADAILIRSEITMKKDITTSGGEI